MVVIKTTLIVRQLAAFFIQLALAIVELAATIVILLRALAPVAAIVPGTIVVIAAGWSAAAHAEGRR
ncbi:TPA: hypothetical protein N2G30_002670 [Salmonella enterica]|nr:hypothetical protein [Salmonella enterica]